MQIKNTSRTWCHEHKTTLACPCHPCSLTSLILQGTPHPHLKPHTHPLPHFLCRNVREFSNLIHLCIRFKVKGRDGPKCILSERTVFPKVKTQWHLKASKKAWPSLCQVTDGPWDMDAGCGAEGGPALPREAAHPSSQAATLCAVQQWGPMQGLRASRKGVVLTQVQGSSRLWERSVTCLPVGRGTSSCEGPLQLCFT